MECEDDEMLKIENMNYQIYSAFHKKGFSLSDISMDVEAGYIYGLIGRNGSGKTTLMSCIAKCSYDSGSMLFLGAEAGLNRMKSKKNIGIILAEPLMAQELTSYENGILIGQYYEEFEECTYLNACRKWRVPLDVSIRNLSRGQQMSASIALMEVCHPKLLLADEPSAGFDPSVRRKFLHFLQEYVEDGEHSVIFATHDTRELDQIADYIYLMEKGKIRYHNDIEGMRSDFKTALGEKPETADVMRLLLDPQKRVIKEERIWN